MALFKKKFVGTESKFLTKSLGIYYTRKAKYNEALKNFNEGLELYPEYDTADVIHRRCNAKRAMTDTENALTDAVYASTLNKDNPHIAMSVAEALQELNQFENSTIALNDDIKHFKGSFRTHFKNKLDVLHANIEDAAGDAYFSFTNKSYKVFLEAWRRDHDTKRIDERPLWKVRKEMQECDVLSVRDREKKLLPPVEIARRSTAFTVFSQNYLQRSWVDVLFLRALSKEKSLKCPRLVESTPILQEAMGSVNNNVNAFLGMLHARNPLYNIEYRMWPKKSRMRINREKILNMKQYQTHRAMHNSLRTIRKLIESGKIDRLTKFVETLMGDYVPVKTSRIMPWKIEFINEVYNYLALAYLDQYRFFKNCCKINQSPLSNQQCLRTLFKLPEEDQIKRVEAEFGDKSMYIEENKAESNLRVHKKFLERMEKRYLFAKYDIERAYISYQIADSYLKWNNYDKCVAIALKGVKEARNCNSLVWELLNYFLICKAQISLRKLEILKDSLGEAFRLAEHLRNLNLVFFIDYCTQLTIEILNSRRSKTYVGTIRRSRYNSLLNQSDKSISQSTLENQLKFQNESHVLQTS